MRKVYREAIDAAFGQGIENAWDFWQMTPAEINGRITAHNEKKQRLAEDMDKLAYMVGAYVARGMNNPKEYPNKPDMIARKVSVPDEPMTEDNLKDILLSFADTHNAIEEVNPHDHRRIRN